MSHFWGVRLVTDQGGLFIRMASHQGGLLSVVVSHQEFCWASFVMIPAVVEVPDVKHVIVNWCWNLHFNGGDLTYELKYVVMVGGGGWGGVDRHAKVDQ